MAKHNAFSFGFDGQRMYHYAGSKDAGTGEANYEVPQTGERLSKQQAEERVRQIAQAKVKPPQAQRPALRERIRAVKSRAIGWSQRAGRWGSW